MAHAELEGIYGTITTEETRFGKVWHMQSWKEFMATNTTEEISLINVISTKFHY